MISPVAGAAVRLMPAPSTANAAAMTKYGVVGVTTLSTAKPPAMIASPAAITCREPNRAASAALRGDTTMKTIGNGSRARPASSGE
jgi:hypothetical protein